MSSQPSHSKQLPPLSMPAERSHQKTGWNGSHIWGNGSLGGMAGPGLLNGAASPRGSEVLSPSAPVSATTTANPARLNSVWNSHRPNVWNSAQATQASTSTNPLISTASPTRTRDNPVHDHSRPTLQTQYMNGSSNSAHRNPIDYPFSAADSRPTPFSESRNMLYDHNNVDFNSGRRNSSDPYMPGHQFSAGRQGSINSRGSDEDNLRSFYPATTAEPASATTQRSYANAFSDLHRQRNQSSLTVDPMSELTDALTHMNSENGPANGFNTNGSLNPTPQTLQQAQPNGFSWPQTNGIGRPAPRQGYQQDASAFGTRDSFQSQTRGPLGGVHNASNPLHGGFSGLVSGGAGSHAGAMQSNYFRDAGAYPQGDADRQQQPQPTYVGSPYYSAVTQQSYDLLAVQQALQMANSQYRTSGSLPLMQGPGAVNTYGMDSAPAPFRHHKGGSAVQDLRSDTLEQYRAGKLRQLQLKDLAEDMVCEFSGDQHGSRFIQEKLQGATTDEKERIFHALERNALQLMKDVFGNYVIQKFFEHGNQHQKRILANKMTGKIADLSTQMYACRVVQKALDHVFVEQQEQMVNELKPKMLPIIHDQNGNHVIQKVIELVPALTIPHIMEEYRPNLRDMALHNYGCRIIQRILEHGTAEYKNELLAIIHENADRLTSDQYGNYVTQHIIKFGPEKDRKDMIALVLRKLITLSKHKYASNVVEKCIEFGSDEDRKRILETIRMPGEDGSIWLPILIKDQYANYVIQTMATKLNGQDREEFHAEATEWCKQLKDTLPPTTSTAPNRPLQAIEKLQEIISKEARQPKPMTNGSKARLSRTQSPSTFGSHGEGNSTVPTPALSNTEQNSPQSTSAPSSNMFGPEDGQVEEPKGMKVSQNPQLDVQVAEPA